MTFNRKINLFLTSCGTSGLSGGLVEPGSDASFPVLVEVGVGQNVITLSDHGLFGPIRQSKSVQKLIHDKTHLRNN